MALKKSPAVNISVSFPRDLIEYLDKRVEETFTGRSLYLQQILRKDMLSQKEAILEAIKTKEHEIEQLNGVRAELVADEQQRQMAIAIMIKTCRVMPSNGSVRDPNLWEAWATGPGPSDTLKALNLTTAQFLELVHTDAKEHPSPEYFTDEEFEAKHPKIKLKKEEAK